MTWPATIPAAIAAVLLGVSALAGGRAITRPVGQMGEALPPEIAEQHGWPKGTLALVNHSLRHTGWRFIMNTDPADRINFVFLPRSTKEANTLLKLFAKIAKNNGRVTLDPRPCQPHTFQIPIKQELNAAIVLSIGSQKILDQWYKTLQVAADGNRTHNQTPLAKAPTAMAPHITIFAGNKALDLGKLKLPKKVAVQAGVSDQHRADHPDDPLVTAIDQLVARHEAKGGKNLRKLLQEAHDRTPSADPQPAPRQPRK